jgi:acyl-CoA synthetase (AMP-forming)/AMP-acid ligase II
MSTIESSLASESAIVRSQRIYRSPLADIEIPDVTLGQHTVFSATTPDGQVALVDARTGTSMTYGDLRTAVVARARGLLARGVVPGDVIAIVGHNQPDFVVALHAALLAGAAVAPLNPTHTVAELTTQLVQTTARTLICAEAVADHASRAADAAGVADRLVLGRHSSLVSFDQVVAENSFGRLPSVDPRTAVALLAYSSGTSGFPKPVMLTHRNLVANLEQTSKAWKIGAEETIVAALPFFHAYGFTIVLHCGLLAGATIVAMPSFDTKEYVRLLARHRCKRAYIVPGMARQIARLPDSESVDLRALRYVLCGGSPLELSTQERAERRLGCRIRQGYGLTEASPGAYQVFEDGFETAPPNCVGYLSPSTEARIVTPDSESDVEWGAVGELLIRGPQVTPGYLHLPQATATIKTGEWLKTGDLVRLDANGYLYIEDRLKDLIKSSGYQVSPSELEAVLRTHPDVIDVAVIGVPHESRGEAPKAFVCASRCDMEAELLEYVASRVARYKQLGSVVHVKEIPRSTAGKVLRAELRNGKRPLMDASASEGGRR